MELARYHRTVISAEDRNSSRQSKKKKSNGEGESVNRLLFLEEVQRVGGKRERGDEIFNNCVEDFIQLLFKRRPDETSTIVLMISSFPEDEILNTIVEDFIRPPFK